MALKKKRESFLLSSQDHLSQIPVVLFLISLCAYIFIRMGPLLKEVPFLIPVSLLLEILNNYVAILIICCLLTDCFFNGISTRKLLFGIIGGLLVHISFSINGDLTLRYAFLFVLAYPRRCTLKTVAKCFWITYSVIIVAVIAACCNGLAHDVVTYEHGLIRHSLGFNSPNEFAVITTIVVLVFIYDVSSHWHICYIPLVLAILLFVFSATNGRMSFILSAFFLVLVSFARSRFSPRALSKPVFFLAKICFPLFFICCIALAIIWAMAPGSFGYDWINPLLNNRPAEMTQFYSEYGYSLFGNKVTYLSRSQAMLTGESITILDNAYVQMAIQFGLVISVLAIALFSLTARYLQISEDLIMGMYLFLIAVFGISECVILSASTNLTLFALGAMLARGTPLFQRVPEERQE